MTAQEMTEYLMKVIEELMKVPPDTPCQLTAVGVAIGDAQRTLSEEDDAKLFGGDADDPPADAPPTILDASGEEYR